MGGESGTVIKTFSVLKDHVKLKVSQDAVSIDNIVFQLHYKVTFLSLLVCCLLVCSKQYIGEHIRCVANEKIPIKFVETYCFISSTYTVTKHFDLNAVKAGKIAHPGVGPDTTEDEVVRHAYYQWVPFVLFLQAILFYIPHYIWKSKEGGRLKALVSGLRLDLVSLREEDLVVNDKLTILSQKNRENKILIIRNAFLNRLHANRPWSIYLGFCEVLNLVNVIGQIYLVDKFLGGAFLGLGQGVVEGNVEGKVDVLDTIFPKVTKCHFHKYGPSGTIETRDALCVMALNIINEKIYIFLWFWLIILAILTGLGLVWRILTMLLYARSQTFNQLLFTMACPGQNNPWNVLSVTRNYKFNDWLFLYYIAKNLDNYVFKELLETLSVDRGDRRHHRASVKPPSSMSQGDKEPTELLPAYARGHKLT